MKKIIFLVIICFLPAVYSSIIGQTYSSYESAYEAFYQDSKPKGFSKLLEEAGYEHCKKLENEKPSNIQQERNYDYPARWDISILWRYHYKGCYIGVHKYDGSARVYGYISLLSNSKYTYEIIGVRVISYDSEK
ncbi:MAG: hypothetical protein LBS20_14335 [Prevotella sp.]|jgi:hypothetical protein|nr:hypothetical protein [Prevotella sp.]